MGHRRAVSLKRRRYSREPRQRFFVFCEGEKTEPTYFTAFMRAFRDALIKVETIAPAGVAYTLAQSAAQRARELGLCRRSRKALSSFEERDEVWAVFDRDEHPRYADAVRICEEVGVKMGRSNPCFEVWLICNSRPSTGQMIVGMCRGTYEGFGQSTILHKERCATVPTSLHKLKKLRCELKPNSGGERRKVIHTVRPRPPLVILPVLSAPPQDELVERLTTEAIRNIY